MSLDRALPFVLSMEGGYVNHPKDPGGATNFGITQKVYDAWRKAKKLPPRAVKQIEAAEVSAIYDVEYWTAGRCGELPWPLSLCHFDACVNHGVAAAAKLIQRAAGTPPDGVIGAMTLAAVRAAPLKALLGEWEAARLKLYYDICQRRPESRSFLLGWVRRMVHLHAETWRFV